jgi:hypothetical protein
MISCKEATNYISRKEEGKLSIRQRWQLWQHLIVCTFCRLFYQQNKTIVKNIPHLEEHSHTSLTSQQKESLIKALESSI